MFDTVKLNDVCSFIHSVARTLNHIDARMEHNMQLGLRTTFYVRNKLQTHQKPRSVLTTELPYQNPGLKIHAADS